MPQSATWTKDFWLFRNSLRFPVNYAQAAYTIASSLAPGWGRTLNTLKSFYRFKFIVRIIEDTECSPNTLMSNKGLQHFNREQNTLTVSRYSLDVFDVTFVQRQVFFPGNFEIDDKFIHWILSWFNNQRLVANALTKIHYTRSCYTRSCHTAYISYFLRCNITGLRKIQ